MTDSIAYRDGCQVMIVDDSAAARGFLTRALEEDSDIRVVSSVSSGSMAISYVQRHPVDVALVDLEMPEMSGLELIPRLLDLHPDIKIIIATANRDKSAEKSVKALSLGASDYMEKPSTRGDSDSILRFNRELIEKVRALSGLSSSGRAKEPAGAPPREPLPSAARARTTQSDEIHYPSRPVKAIAIGASTGGPQALLRVMEGLGQQKPGIPVYIVQHMPPRFTTILSEHIRQASGLPCYEATDGQKVESDGIYLAPGDYHMEVRGERAHPSLHVHHGPMEHYCRPAVDPLLRSLVPVYGGEMLVVILTGMGQDGLIGAKAAHEAGATVIAQDQATSVVWGMPRMVAEAGICSAVLPLDAISDYIHQSLGKTHAGG